MSALTLPARIYLLACDTDRHRLRGHDIEIVVRAALLAELNLRGCLVEEGRVVRSDNSRRTGDALLDDELRIMSESRPRGWRAWLHQGARSTLAAVRDQLASAGLITVDRSRRLGVFPVTRVTPTGPAQVAALREFVLEAVRGTGPVSAVSTEDATLVALVAVGELRTVLSRTDRWTHRARIAEFTERGGDVVVALRRVVRRRRSARSS
jgi:hypothetical protein